MATTISTRISFLGSEVTGQPLATNTRETPLSVKLSYTDGVEGVNMVWSMTDGDHAGGPKNLDITALVDDRGTVSFTHLHGYTFNVRSGTLGFVKAGAAVSSYYRYMPMANDFSTGNLVLTGPGQISYCSSAPPGDATVSPDNRLIVFQPSVGADYDVILYGVGTIV